MIQWSEQKPLVNTFISAEAKERSHTITFKILLKSGRLRVKRVNKSKEQKDVSVLLWVLFNSTSLILVLKANDKTGVFKRKSPIWGQVQNVKSFWGASIPKLVSDLGV